MQGDTRRVSGRDSSECEPLPSWPAATAQGSSWANAEVDSTGAKGRLARLARTIENDVIPRLVQAHRPGAVAAAAPPVTPSEAEVDAFVTAILHAPEPEINRRLAQLRERGVSVEALFLDLLAPAARQLGTMWDEDLCDFSTVTVALGRLQRLLRDLSPAFGSEVDHPVHGRRALFVQPRDEQHSFGLSMVAEFFRRDGWDVLGGVGGTVTDPAAKVRDEWLDIVGFSVGSDGRLEWLSRSIQAVRAATRNPHLVVLVGGPPFTIRPERVAEVGADGTARDGKLAPQLAERLLGERRQSK